jgi:hypothetical protein
MKMNMNTPSTEFIFPPRLIPGLRDLREEKWAEFIDHIDPGGPNDADRIAFELVVVRWSGCVNCQADSFRAMQGCSQCMAQAVRRYRGGNAEFQRLITEAKREIEGYLTEKDE